MRRRDVIAMLGGAAVAWPRNVHAQAAPTLRLGEPIIVPRSSPSQAAFEQRLHELGYIEGQNFTLVGTDLDIQGHLELIGAATQELVRRKVDILMAFGPEAFLKAAHAATQTVPIVMVAIGYDPIALGYVTGLARPTGNITGIVFQQIEVTVKRLQLMRDAFPDMRSATVFWDRDGADSWRAAENAAAGLGLRLEGVEFRDQPYDYERGLGSVSEEARRILFVINSTMFFVDRKRLADFALSHGMASVFWERELVDAGGLMSYGASLTGLYRRAADYVDRIARGAKPSDLPIEQPTRFELVINLNTAKTLGITIPPMLLVRADAVIE